MNAALDRSPRVLCSAIAIAAAALGAGCDLDSSSPALAADQGGELTAERVAAEAGKADVVSWNVTGAPGAIGSVLVESNHGLVIQLQNTSAARADILVYVGTVLVAQSAVAQQPSLVVPDYGERIQYNITVINRSLLFTLRNALLVVDRGPFGGDDGGDPDPDDDVPLAGSAHVVGASTADLSSGDLEDELDSLSGIDWELRGFAMRDTPADVASLAVLTRGSALRFATGTSDEVEEDVNLYTAGGWTVESFHYTEEPPADVESVVWLERAGEFRVLLGSTADVADDLELYAEADWQPHTFLYRGAGAAVAWLERQGSWRAVVDTPERIEDELNFLAAAGWQPRAFQQTGDHQSLAWLACDGSYRAAGGHTPGELADRVNLFLDADCQLLDLAYAGDESVIWMMRNGQLRTYETTELRDLDDALELLLDAGWSLYRFHHRGPQALVALFLR
jgi:hypothetical protein